MKVQKSTGLNVQLGTVRLATPCKSLCENILGCDFSIFLNIVHTRFLEQYIEQCT